MQNVQEKQSETEDYSEIIFRNDDVNPNTDFKELEKIYETIFEHFPEIRIIQAITPFSYSKGIKGQGEIYQDGVPFKDNPPNWFYYVNKCVTNFPKTGVFALVESASHGLLHVDHSRIHRDAQEMSIITSCEILGVKVFIPPFNRWNEDTEDICRKNGITLIKSHKWKSLEFEEFDPEHRLWYFHSWRWTHKKIRRHVWRIPLNKRKQQVA